MSIKNNKRSDSFSVENIHDEYYDNGVPVFKGEKKIIKKKLRYNTTYCPECGGVCHSDSKGRASCSEACGGFIDSYAMAFDGLKSTRLTG